MLSPFLLLSLPERHTGRETVGTGTTTPSLHAPRPASLVSPSLSLRCAPWAFPPFPHLAGASPCWHPTSGAPGPATPTKGGSRSSEPRPAGADGGGRAVPPANLPARQGRRDWLFVASSPIRAAGPRRGVRTCGTHDRVPEPWAQPCGGAKPQRKPASPRPLRCGPFHRVPLGNWPEPRVLTEPEAARGLATAPLVQRPCPRGAASLSQGSGTRPLPSLTARRSPPQVSHASTQVQRLPGDPAPVPLQSPVHAAAGVTDSRTSGRRIPALATPQCARGRTPEAPTACRPRPASPPCRPLLRPRPFPSPSSAARLGAEPPRARNLPAALIHLLSRSPVLSSVHVTRCWINPAKRNAAAGRWSESVT